MSFIRPMKMLFLSPIVLALSTFMAVVYGYLYLLFTTLTGVFEGTYHFSSGAVGLTYLGIGLGSILGLVLFGSVSDRIVKAKSAAGEMKPEYRLPPMIPGAWAIPIGCKFRHQSIFSAKLAYAKKSSVHLWLDGRKSSALDCANSRHRTW